MFIVVFFFIFVLGRRNCEDFYDIQFVEKQILQVFFDLKLNIDYNYQGLKLGKFLKIFWNWVGFVVIVNV